MKDILVIKVHSFIDVITNSSSELFVVKDKKQTVETIREILSEIIEVCCPNIPPTEDIYEIEVCNKKVAKDYVSEWYDINISPGDIIIKSSCDNSIPYSIFEIIEERFNAKRYHLG